MIEMHPQDGHKSKREQEARGRRGREESWLIPPRGWQAWAVGPWLLDLGMFVRKRMEIAVGHQHREPRWFALFVS